MRGTNREKDIFQNDILHLCMAEEVTAEVRIILIEAACYLDDNTKVLEILDLCDLMPGMDESQRKNEMKAIKALIEERKEHYHSIRQDTDFCLEAG